MTVLNVETTPVSATGSLKLKETLNGHLYVQKSFTGPWLILPFAQPYIVAINHYSKIDNSSSAAGIAISYKKAGSTENYTLQITGRLGLIEWKNISHGFTV